MNSDRNGLLSFQDILLSGFKSDEYSLTRELAVFALWFVLFVVAMYVLMAYNPQQGVHGNVRFHMFNQLMTQVHNGNPPFGLTANWLIYGSTDFAVNGTLLPAYVVSARFPPVMVPIVAFTIMAAELFTALYVACRLFRLPVHVSLIAGLSFSYMLFLLIRTLIYGRDLPGYASLMTVILFLGGVQLIGIGVLGEYTARIFDEVKRRPVYIVRETFTHSDAESEKQAV